MATYDAFKQISIHKISKYYPALLILLIGYCTADLIILNVRDLMLPSGVPPAKPPKTISETMPTRSQYDIVISRNIFSSIGEIPDPLVSKGLEKRRQEMEIPVLSSLPLNLVGTLVHSNPAKSIANIDVKGKNQVFAFTQDRDIDGIATLVKVERKKAIIRNTNNGRLEYIEIKEAGTALNFSGAKNTVSTSKGSSEVVQLSPTDIEIKKNVLDKYLGDMASILQQAAMQPKRNANGEVEGFQFMSIQPGSIYTQLGLKNRDVIKGVNGEKVDSPAKAMDLFNALKTSSNIKLQIERDGREVDMNFNITK